MRNFYSLIDAINQFEMEGYTEDFDLNTNYLSCGNRQIPHDEFTVDEFYRFEDDSSADQQSIIYAISADKYNLKGIMINGYNIYNDSASNEILNKLKIR